MLERVSPELLASLQSRYAEPQRHYHDWSHVEALLAHARSIEGRLADPVAVTYAILFHDAVYDPRAKDNERQSAALLLREAPSLGASSLELAHAMILATEGHQLSGLPSEQRSDAAHFLDMDLAILGAEEDRFDIYEDQIRLEYAHVPDEAFRAGRRAVLESFAGRESLYFSDWGRERFEGRARANLARSLAKLTG